MSREDRKRQKHYDRLFAAMNRVASVTAGEVADLIAENERYKAEVTSLLIEQQFSPGVQDIDERVWV